MTRKILGLAAVLLAVVVPGASAEPFTPELEVEYHEALSAWGVSAPPACTAVTLEVVSDDAIGLETNGRATQPLGESIPCRLELSEEVAYETPHCMRLSVLEHEVGHLLGWGHSPSPNSIMAPSSPPYLCEVAEIRRERLWLRAFTTRCRTAGREQSRPRRWRHRHCTSKLQEERETLTELERSLPPAPSFP